MIISQRAWPQAGPKQISAGFDAMPETVEVDAKGEIAITQAGERILEEGQFFVSRDSGKQERERLAIVAAHQVEIPNERLLMPVPLAPTQHKFAVVLEASSPTLGDKPVRFMVPAPSLGMDVGFTISLVGDPPEGKTLWFVAKINWGRDPWLVDLGDWPQGRLPSVTMEYQQSSMVWITPPGFTSAPRNPRIFQAASGAVTNSNLDALYDQSRDRALIFGGPHVELFPERHDTSSTYFVNARLGGGSESTREDAKSTLLSVSLRDGVIATQVQFFRPMSEEIRKQFPAARSGWFSIYSGLRREDTEKEVLANMEAAAHYEELLIKGADWFVKNLRPDAYGPINILVTDMHGLKEVPLQKFDLTTPDTLEHHRDWRVQDKTLFPHGVKWLADEFHQRGMQLGSWVILDAWDAEDLYKDHPDWFLHYPDGRPIYFGVWNGKYFLDGSNPEALNFLREETRRYTHEWGIDNWWVDGNWTSDLARIASAAPYFYDKSVPWWEAHRRLVQAMREGAGPESYLQMESGVPLTAMGIANGSRTASDPNANSPVGKYGDGNCCEDWKGAYTTRTGTMDWYFLNRTGWYCDPADAFVVGYPLTLDQAHVWGPMLSLTGQVLMLGEPVYEMEPDRVPIAKALFPSPPVRPVELYSRQGQTPEVWDLRVGHVGHQWDVIMFLNWETQPRTISVNLEDLGMASCDKYLLFDFWEKKSLGAVSTGRLELSVPATGSRLIRVTPLVDHPELFGLTRHVTQGLVDLRGLGWEDSKKMLWGESAVPGGDPYQFWVNVPQGFSFRSIQSSAGEARCEAASTGVLVCTISTPDTAQVKWTLQF
jgi:hypothetical protein